jgi:hypothetical protein
MNHPAAFARRGRFCLLPALLFIFSITFAQDYEQLRQQKLNSLDLSGLGERLFLNCGLTTQYEINHFKNLNKNEKSQVEPVSAEEWLNLYDRLVDTDLRSAPNRLRELANVTETNAAKMTKSNVVPIGIINLEGLFLSDEELAKNESSKKARRPVDFSKYETVRIVSASVLQEDLYQAKVSFYINHSLNIDNHAEKVAVFEIDFNDGKGFTKYPVADQLIVHRFESVGEHRINIRFYAGSIAYAFETKVNVKQMERAPYEEFDITAKPFFSKSSEADSSARSAFVGGTLRIIKGCDQILDKPIIIAEGFDMGQNVNLDAIEANYRERLNQYLIEGYDLVLLDYNDGRAAIQDNAQVLKAAIELVNAQKTGIIESIVIGESMSGLVARWALREMENAGLPHHVRLMLCYDTPHQGANVPVGLTQLAYDAGPTLLTKVILKFFAKGWRNYYTALGTPAARQLLLHQTGSPNIGKKHPDFDNFRSQLFALGNNGYPLDCRNIAVINGSMTAGDRVLFNTYNYGSRLLLSWTPFGLQNTNIDIHTNDLNKNESVLRFAAWGFFAKKSGVNRKYISPLNDDFLPGGRTQFGVPNKLFGSTLDFEFCFVPTFSSIDFEGSLTTQSERELLNINEVNAEIINRQTPFDAIYGNDNNTPHVAARLTDWIEIGIAEGLLTGTPACPALPVPPIPTITGYNTCYPFSDKRTTEDNTPDITVSLKTTSNGLYVHNWTVLPANQYFITTGDQITFQAEKADHYEVTCVRTYPNRADLSSKSTATIWVSDCKDISANPDNGGAIFVDKTDVWEGDFLLTTAVDSVAVFAHYYPVFDVLYASLENGTFVPRATLINSGMFEEFAALFSENHPNAPLPVHLISFNARSEGKAALLSWATASELNCDRFVIERSESGKVWKQVGSIQARNNTSSEEEYFFTDSEVVLRRAYYRLKLIDIDGSFAYSNIKPLDFGGSQSAIFPNPAGNDGQLQLLQSEDISMITIFNLSGKKELETSTITNKISIQHLPPGSYILRLRHKDGSDTSHTVVKR